MQTEEPASDSASSDVAGVDAEDSTTTQAGRGVVDLWMLGVAAGLVAMGGVLLWIVPMAEADGVPVSSRFAIFDLAYAFFGRWGLFWCFAGPAALLVLGVLFQLADHVPWLAFIGRVSFGLIVFVVMPLGGAWGAYWCFGQGRWVLGLGSTAIALFGGLALLLEGLHQWRRLGGAR